MEAGGERPPPEGVSPNAPATNAPVEAAGLKGFYERWAAMREASPLEQDYERRAADWKWARLEELIQGLGPAPASVLEFGCGSGEMLERAGKAFAGARLRGIDLSERMVAMARQRLPAAEVTCGGIGELEAFGPAVDLALAVDILEHLEDPVRAARALGRAGRRVALKIPLERRVVRLGLRRQRAGPEHHVAGHLHFWTLGESRALLRRAGSRFRRFSRSSGDDRYHPAAQLSRAQPWTARLPPAGPPRARGWHGRRISARPSAPPVDVRVESLSLPRGWANPVGQE
jgi:SAM-dependent methyltransferase